MKIFSMTIAILLLTGLYFGSSIADAKSSSGKDIFMKYKCNSCHAVKAEDIQKKESKKKKKKERKAPDLSSVGLERDLEWLNKYQMKKIKIDGKKHPKKFKGTDEELQSISNWLLGLKEKIDSK